MNVYFLIFFMQKLKMAAKYCGKTIFGKSRQLTAETLWVISEINALFLGFLMQKFKMVTKNGGKMII